MKPRPTVLYDGGCGFCRSAKRIAAGLDWLHLLTWESAPGIDAIYYVAGSRRWSGYRAWKRIAVRLPLVWLAAAGAAWLNPWTLLALALALSPLANPAGEAVYQWVARHRHGPTGAESCDRDRPPTR